MRECVFKVNYEVYGCKEYYDHVPLPHNRKFTCENHDDTEPELFSNIVVESSNRVSSPRLIYNEKISKPNEEGYVENYGNPLAYVSKFYSMVVVEKDGDKVSLKVFWGYRERNVGVSWFRVGRNMQYLTVNTRTGDVYSGHLLNYNKKRKCVKTIHKNYFISEPINVMKRVIKSVLQGYTVSSFSILNDAISKFMFEVNNLEVNEPTNADSNLFKFYLDKKGFKYPNNFYLYRKILLGPKIKKRLKKCENKLIESFMIENNLSGKKLRKALHECEALNLDLYYLARKLFGDDRLNQEPGFILNLLNYEKELYVRETSIPDEFITLISKDELYRVFKLFKKVYVDKKLNSNTFYDHIRMYTELKLYGETDLRWYSDDSDGKSFRMEHLDWTDKLQFYKRGHYVRKYPQYTYELIEAPIDGYYPVVLNNSTDYNAESSIQSNCVKGYVTKASSIIISLRKGSNDSDERATIEYKVSRARGKIAIDRVQSLGKFNNKLEEHWLEPLFKLDERLLSYINDERFETVSITKKCVNNAHLDSTSEWDSLGSLTWTFKNIESNYENIFNLIQ